MNVDKWIEALQHPLVLAGFGLFIFAALIKPLFFNNSKLSSTATERMLHKGMNFAFALALLAIAGGLLLHWERKKSDKQIGLTNEQQTDLLQRYAQLLQEKEDSLRKRQEAGNVTDSKQRHVLEQQLLAVQEKRANIPQSYEEDLQRRRDAEASLVVLKGHLSDAQIKQLKMSLQQGDIESAEKVFDAVAIPIAAYQSGQLAAGRLDYEKALRQYEKAVELEPDNPDYLLAAGQMARTVADYEQSEKWLKKLLQLKEEKNKEDESLATVLNGLALLYRLQGRYAEAEPLMKRSLAVKEKVLGQDHPSLVFTLNNLAMLYEVQGKYEEMEQTVQRALTICEKSVGKESVCAASALHNLAGTYHHQGRYAEAEPLYRHALAIREKIFGTDHPDVAMTLTGLANLYARQGRYAEADPLYKRSLEIEEKTLGKDHPSVAGILGCLAGSYFAQGRYNEAEPLYQQAIAILKKKFPDGHPTLDYCQKNYDDLKQKMAEKSK